MPLVERLRTRGHDAVAPDLPFDDPLADYDARAQPALAALNGAVGPVVVVGHSVGSAEAALVAAKRPPVLLVYVCPRFGSFAVPPEAPDVFRTGFPFPPKDMHGRLVWEPENPIATMYPRLPTQTGRELAKRLRPGAAPVGRYPLSSHPDVPTALIYTTDDEFFTPEWERFVAEQLGVAPIELPYGHFPMLEDPDLLADVLERLAADAARPG
jgi:pimeloyl-ACP methyl ester carboxylesterase